MGLVCDIGPIVEAIKLKAQIGPYGFDEVVNKAMKDVALRSIAYTPSVSSAVIAEQTRRQITTRFATKTGKRLKTPKAVYGANTAAVAIMVVRLRKAGKLEGMTGAQIREMALKMVQGRVRSAGYLKSGLLAAAQPFGGGSSSDGAHLYKAPGGGVLATPEQLVAEIHNDVPVAHWVGGYGAAAYEAAERAMQDGMNSVERDIMVYVARQLAKAGFDT